MNKKTAKLTLDKMISLNKELDELLIVIKKDVKPEEFDNYQQVFGKIMGTILLDIVNPIIKEHPELKPKELE